MKLSSVELLHVRRALSKPFRISVGQVTAREFIVLRGRGEGFTLWAEVNVDLRPFYTDEYVASAWDVIRSDLLPAVLNVEVGSARDVQARWRHVRGHAFAKAAVEALFWDLEGRTRGRSIRSLLGGDKDRVAIGTSHSIYDSTGELLKDVARAVERGIRRIKLKIQPGYDYQPLRAVRDAFPDVQLMADANASYPARAIEDLRRLDEVRMIMLEQPFAHHALVASALLRKRAVTPVCFDESLHDLDQLQAAVALAAVDIGNVKVGRVGGLSHVLEIHAWCRENGVPLWVGRRTAGGISTAYEAAVGALPGFTYPADLGGGFVLETGDSFVDPAQFDYRDGTIAVPDRPGLGVEVDEARLERITLHRERVG